MGSTSDGSQVTSSPSTVTLYVSGSTWMSGVASLYLRSALDSDRMPETGRMTFCRPSSSGTPASMAAWDRNVMEDCCTAFP
ncbi:hypothetical protein FQZ97_982750 [compost metagenome]